ncbi:hypothetical protein IWQ60_002775 [Tieghemiomyces parasiticus]|uniref:glutathione-specific gamma-glutamylcyclotransferase n=1 Tax=Tieghemiomyces parasiticus TaxID=78921 RepID=A0A9W8E0N6_9FUNG|nr:hypothetical protein IWQ60_002775 [Tieghemiomyces parasiticus]
MLQPTFLPFLFSRPGYIKGFVRRFWQESHDHRGTDEHPGRVVTLVPVEELGRFEDNLSETITWGMAYKVAKDKVEEVRQHLDHREKDGYTSHHVHVYHPNFPEPVVEDAMVYMGTSDNESFAGPASIDHIAHQIYSSYFLNLCHALRSLSPEAFDSHLAGLEKRVLAIQQEAQDKQDTSPSTPSNNQARDVAKED